MAKAANKGVSDWAIILVLVLLIVASNLYWLLAVRDIEERLDGHASAVLQLQDCYNNGTVPCN